MARRTNINNNTLISILMIVQWLIVYATTNLLINNTLSLPVEEQLGLIKEILRN